MIIRDGTFTGSVPRGVRYLHHVTAHSRSLFDEQSGMNLTQTAFYFGIFGLV